MERANHGNENDHEHDEDVDAQAPEQQARAGGKLAPAESRVRFRRNYLVRFQ
jgi:hypothetical protein